MNNEEIIIKKIVEEVVKRLQCTNEAYVPIGISNRHVHLTTEDLEVLFGKGYQLTKMKDLKQPGQYAAQETITVIGPKGEFKGVRILGPVRKETQLELSLSDGFKLGVNVPVRESGKTEGTPKIVLKGPMGTVEKDQAVIAALRHIHMPAVYAESYGFKDKEMVTVEVGDVRRVSFHNVLVRVSKDFDLEMHLDIDEANAAAICNGDLGKILKD